MFIMKVVHNNEIELVRDLQELRELLKKKNITIGLVESKEGSSHLVKIMCDEEGYSGRSRPENSDCRFCNRRSCAIRPSSVRWRSCGLTWES